MASTFETVAGIIAETCDLERDTITPESHAINDLGIDSLDFLDVAFAIDKSFGIKMPLEQWTQDVNEGRATSDDYFVMKNLCAAILATGKTHGPMTQEQQTAAIEYAHSVKFVDTLAHRVRSEPPRRLRLVDWNLSK